MTTSLRSYLEVNVGGGPGTRPAGRRMRVNAAVERLCALGARRLRPIEEHGEDWVVMQDWEGNEVCLQ